MPLEQVIVELAKQIPALLALIGIVYVFLRTMSSRDVMFLENQKEISKELRKVASAIARLCRRIEQIEHDMQSTKE